MTFLFLTKYVYYCLQALYPWNITSLGAGGNCIGSCVKFLICHRHSAVWKCSVFYSAPNNLFCSARRIHWQMFPALGIYPVKGNRCKGLKMPDARNSRHNGKKYHNRKHLSFLCNSLFAKDDFKKNYITKAKKEEHHIKYLHKALFCFFPLLISIDFIFFTFYDIYKSVHCFI